MLNTSQKFRFKKIIWLLILSIGLTNLLLVLTDKTYLYSGISKTYLKGKIGPTIYDSTTFATRVATHSLSPEKWETKTSLLSLNQREKDFLESLETTSFLIIKNGKIISETYFEKHTISTKSNSFSAAKSFLGLLIGIAIDEGKINSFDDLINDYLPFHLSNSETITIRDLLAMSSGLNWSESGGNPFSDNAEAYYTSDLLHTMKKNGFDIERKGIFEYKSGNSELLAFILKEATGKNPTLYLQEKVWSRIGTENDAYWSLDAKNGIEKAFCCVYATTRDYAKFGQLLLNNGKWGEQTIIDSTTLAEIIAPISKTTPFYSLHFWRFNHPQYPAIYARGILGQYIFSIPSLNVVLVRTGHNRLPSYTIPEENRKNKDFLLKNNYKRFHPEEIQEYYTILERILKADSLTK